MTSIAAQLARDRAAAQGVGTNRNPAKYLDQDYEQLKAQCLASGKLFEDPTFPAAQASLGVSNTEEDVVWKRPSEIHENPEFISGGTTRFDVRQGALADCWLLCSIGSLTLNQENLNRVVPMDQSFTESYCGIFHFKFWQYGQWLDVVVDDLLPTKNEKLMYVKSNSASEFWSALLEKAYAKLNGSYDALKGGIPVEALEDFTGGIGELYFFKDAPDNLFQIIRNALYDKALVTCSTQLLTAVGEVVVETNIVKNHAYSLTGAEEVTHGGDTAQIVRVRNPWGHKEWTGAWSDNAPEWEEVDPKVKSELNLKSEDGETWIPFSSFLVEFFRVDICHLHLDAASDDESKWYLTVHNGKWTKGVNAGGCRSNGATFWTNPQIRITLEERDAVGSEDKTCTVVVSLMQKERRRKKPLGEELLGIIYYIYKDPDEFNPDLILGKEFLDTHPAVGTVTCYQTREVSNRFQLPVGKYVIVPATYYPNGEADFYLRVISDNHADAIELGNVVEARPFKPLAESAPEAGEAPSEEKLEEFNAEDLRLVLNKKLSSYPDIKFPGFSLKTCREMINLMDIDNTRTLSTAEYNTLWKKLEFFIKIFLEVDVDRSGTINAYELRNALPKAGYKLNTKIQEVIVHRFVQDSLDISFEDFISCLIRLETVFKMFEILRKDDNESVTLTLYEWVCSMLA